MEIGLDFKIKKNAYHKIKTGIQSIVLTQDVLEMISQINYNINVLDHMRK